MSRTFSFGCLSFSHLNFETEVCHARCLPQAELGSNRFTISHNEVKEKRCSAAHFDLKAVLLRNLSVPTLWSWDMQFHSAVSGVAFITAMEKSTESAKEVGLAHAQ